MDFGLFYFDGEGAVRRPNKYRLLLDSARFADDNGFTAVWTPERHFHAFGGLYPNPAVTSAALAAATQNVQIRAGSVVAPLHHPVRLAEDWAVVDNLSGGRVAMAFAPGWTVTEFMLSPEGHAARYETLWSRIDILRRLWAGEEVELPGEDGKPVRVQTLPRPLQRKLPLWITATSEAGFARAGSIGAPVLTSLLYSNVDAIAANVARYRATLEEHGHDPASGRVAMMVHTFVGPDLATAREQIEEPFRDYLKSHFHLLDGLAKNLGFDASMKDLSPADLETLLKFGFEGFLDGRSLIGGVRELRPVVESFAGAGVDELACLIDFHPGYAEVMGSLEHLAKLKDDCFGLRTRVTVALPKVDAKPRPSIPRATAAIPSTHEDEKVSTTESAVPEESAADPKPASKPTRPGADLPEAASSVTERLAKLSPEQRQILRRQLAKRGRSKKAQETTEEAPSPEPVSDEHIPKRDPNAPLPLSHAQERLWFLNRLERDNAFYNIPMGLRMRGPLRVEALEQAFREIIRRHEVLRTTFVAEGGIPQQKIHTDLSPGFAHIDRTAVMDEDRDVVLSETAREEARLPFDMERGPLIRAALVRFASDDHGFLLSIHHTVADGWSRGVIVGELEKLYRAFVTGRPSPLNPLEVQYGDFAIWQRRWLSKERLETEMQYWRERLEGVRELRLPTDRPRFSETVHEGAKLLRVLPQTLLDRVKTFARTARVTPFTALLGAYKILLQRLAAENDVVVGVPTANRNWPATEPMVGFFVNSLVMRTDLGGDPTFRELLERVRATAVGAFEHRNIPFERIVEQLRPERTLGRNPLFQVTFQFQDASYGRQNSLAPKHDFPELSIERLAVDTGTALFDLSMNLGEIEEGLGVLVEYSTTLWDRERIEALVRQLVRLVEDGIERPDVPISQLSWLDDAGRARAQVLADQSLHAVPQIGEPVHQRIARHAKEQPNTAAIVSGELQISYEELVARARRLGEELAGHGAGPESVVAVCLPRGPGSALAPLATLEAGAAYLPLDPADPARRRRATVTDVSAVVVITDAKRADDFASLTSRDGREVAVVDVTPFLTEPHNPTQPMLPTSRVDPDQLAYVVYTSGSTGIPKGVGVPHRGLAHLIAWQESCWPIGPGDRGTSLAGLGFDAIVWELWMTLTTGGTLVLPARDLRLDPTGLATWLVSEGIHVTFAPTPIAERLLAEPVMRKASELRVILSGGDKLTLRPDSDLPFVYANVYGPAENSVVATMGEVEPQDRAVGPPPIGKPLPGVTAHVLDSRLGPVPIGAPGELCVGGRGLARGYLQRPGLTASRFVPDPFSTVPGARLYRTGDRVRFLADGRLAFLGRTDHQVKVRGARLELGEIEAILARHESVREVAVGTTGSGSGRALVAFVVADDKSEAEGADSTARDEVHVGDWRRLYDSTYGSERSEDDARNARFDLVGWMSSYDGRPIPRPEMRAWVEEAVERILALEPKRVLEIGSGTGLLLYRIAPTTERYVGIDFSAEAVERVRREVERPGEEIHGVELHVARADELAEHVDGSFDTVIVNSVAQYFPNVDYLEKVIVAAMAHLEEGGRLFLGDMRHADLDEAFYGSIALAQAAEDEPIPAVAIRAEETAARESELLVSPDFFHAMAARHPRIRGVQVRPKRFSAPNELSRFRYDVVLELDAVCTPAEEYERNSFEEFDDLETLHDHLARTRPNALVIDGIANARVAAAVTAAHELFNELAEEADPEPAARLMARGERATASAYDPDDLWHLGSELGLNLDVRFAAESSEGTLELHIGATGTEPAEVNSNVDLAVYGRKPAGNSHMSALATELRAYLDERLPGYMVPERFVPIPSIPITNRGKVDRRRLAALDPGRKSDASRYVAPRGVLEERVAEIFGRVLSVDRVGALDDFFDLGGHSLMATRVVAELEDALGVALELRTLFSATTVEALAIAIAERTAKTDGETEDSETNAAALAPITRRSFDDEPAPASYGQRRLWLLERLLPGTPVYHMPACERLKGPLDADRLVAALDVLVARHEALRTALLQRETPSRSELDVIQVVAPAARMPIERIDLSGESEAERTDRAEKLVAEAIRRPFDLTQAPLARALLLRFGPEHHELVVTLHHAIADGWSIGVILREFGALYAGGDAIDALPELSITYRDYSAWQREDARANNDFDWWRKALDGAPSQLALPTDRPRPQLPSFRGDRVDVAIHPPELNALDALAREHRATRFMVTLAAWQIVVRALSGEDDLVMISPVAGRRRPETHGLVGFFVNSVPLRTRMDGAATFGELVDATRLSCLGAFDHVDLPFESILEALRLDRDLGAAPFAQVAFALQNVAGGRIEVEGLDISIAPLATDTAKTDLSLMLNEPGAALDRDQTGLSGVLEFATDLFDRSTAETIVRAFEEIVRAGCTDPSQTVDALAERVVLPVATTGDLASSEELRVAAPLVAGCEKSNLSDNQLLVWTGQQLDRDAPLHILAIAFEIDAGAVGMDLNIPLFKAALDILVQSTDALRAVIVEHEGVPRLEVREHIDPGLICLDLSDVDAAERESRIAAIAFEPLNLTERVFRTALFQIGEGRFTWLFASHQVVTDGESVQIIADTLSDLYAQAVSGTLPQSVEMPSYLDHLAWEQAERQRGGFDEAQAYWQSLLDDRPEPPRFYGSTGVKASLAVRRIYADLPRQITENLERVLGELAGRAAGRSVTRFRFFLAVFAAYLYRVSGRRRVVIAMPWRNRRRKSAKGTVGLFMRSVPVELTVDGHDTLEDLFQRTRQAVKQAIRHGEQVVRNPIDAPLYDVALNLHTSSHSNFAGAPVQPSWLCNALGFESLALQVEDFGNTGRLRLALDLHSDIFDDELEALVGRQLTTLLTSALDAKDQPIDTLALDPAPDGSVELRPEAVEASLSSEPNQQTVLDAFDAWVASAPDALAILDGDHTLSYGELDRATRAVANRLVEHGVGAGREEPRVALAIDRSAEIVAAMLGVLRAGAGFLVIDPGMPADRVEQMLDTAKVKLILAGANRREALPSGPWTVLQPSSKGEDNATFAAHPLDLQSAAYVVFTSGSTGEPKGVVIDHGALAAFARATVATYGLGPNDRMLQLSSLAYDGSIEEIFGALTSGAGLVLRDGRMLVDPARYVERCTEARVTMLGHPTAFWQQMWRTIATQGLTPPPSLRVILVGGERLDPKGLAPWREQASSGQAPILINTYGPTETTVVVSHHAVSTEPEDARRRDVPIGKALGDAQLYVVDRLGALTATSIVGELLVGGPTVARGYLGLPGSTAERFVPDPFSGKAGARLYRTGDLARRRGDGALEYVGRADRQVKVRGYRVELAEVERALTGLPEVSDAAVLDILSPSGIGRALIGFVTAPPQNQEERPALTAADLRVALEERLPAYMVPPRWVLLGGELPQDARGKTDRRALLALVPKETAEKEEYVAPRGEVERIVAEVWAEVLGIERVGAQDNFFELGGTSLSLVQMHPALVERLGVSLELVDLFRHPTVHALARHLAGDSEQEERAAKQRDERVVGRRKALARRRKKRYQEEVVA